MKMSFICRRRIKRDRVIQSEGEQCLDISYLCSVGSEMEWQNADLPEVMRSVTGTQIRKVP